MEGQLIDASTLSVDAVAGFVPDIPTGLPMSVRPGLQHTCVVSIHQPIQISTPAPGHIHDGRRVQCA